MYIEALLFNAIRTFIVQFNKKFINKRGIQMTYFYLKFLLCFKDINVKQCKYTIHLELYDFSFPSSLLQLVQLYLIFFFFFW